MRIRPLLRRGLTVTVVLASLGLVACSDGSAQDAAVRVNGHAITKAEVSHMMSVIGGRSATPPTPPPPVPDPPHYTACIAYRRAYRPVPAGQPKPTPAQLTAECDLEYQRSKLKALYFLITVAWTTGEAAELGVKLSAGEVRQELAAFEHVIGANYGGFQRYLTDTRATRSDILRTITVELLTKKVQQELERPALKRRLSQPARQHALEVFGKAFIHKWTGRTDCSAGYVVPACKQYRPPKTPPLLVPPSIPLANMAAEE